MAFLGGMLGGTATGAAAGGAASGVAGAEAGTEMASMMAANGAQAAAPTAAAMTGASNPSMWSRLLAGAGNPNATKDGMLNLGQFFHGFTDQGAGATLQGWENQNLANQVQGKELENLVGYENRVAQNPDMQKNWLVGLQTQAKTGHTNALMDGIRNAIQLDNQDATALGGMTPGAYNAMTSRTGQQEGAQLGRDTLNENTRQFDITTGERQSESARDFGQRQTEFNTNTRSHELDQVISLLNNMRMQSLHQQDLTQRAEEGKRNSTIAAFNQGAYMNPNMQSRFAAALGQPNMFGNAPTVGGVPSANATNTPDEKSLGAIRSFLGGVGSGQVRPETPSTVAPAGPRFKGIMPMGHGVAAYGPPAQYNGPGADSLMRLIQLIGYMPSYAVGNPQHRQWVDEQLAK